MARFPGTERVDRCVDVTNLCSRAWRTAFLINTTQKASLLSARLLHHTVGSLRHRSGYGGLRGILAAVSAGNVRDERSRGTIAPRSQDASRRVLPGRSIGQRPPGRTDGTETLETVLACWPHSTTCGSLEDGCCEQRRCGVKFSVCLSRAPDVAVAKAQKRPWPFRLGFLHSGSCEVK